MYLRDKDSVRPSKKGRRVPPPSSKNPLSQPWGTFAQLLVPRVLTKGGETSVRARATWGLSSGAETPCAYCRYVSFTCTRNN